MISHINLWTASGAWAVMTLAVWALFVPSHVSVPTFLLLGLTGVLLLFYGWTFIQESRPARSVSAILAELDAQPKEK
jgi:hypothetical protein